MLEIQRVVEHAADELEGASSHHLLKPKPRRSPTMGDRPVVVDEP